MKKILSFILSAILLISAAGSLSAFSAADESGFDAANITASFGIAADTLTQSNEVYAVKLLMIGNSFSQNAYNQIRKVAESMGVNLIVENVYRGGCSLQQHWDAIQHNTACYDLYKSWGDTVTGTVADALSEYDWDYISVQQVSGLSGLYSTYQPYLDNILGYLRQSKPNAEIIFHQTWAYQKTSTHSDFPRYNSDQDTMWAAIEEASKTAAEHAGIRIVPSGKAFQNARATSIGDNLNSDGYHANSKGEYLAAMCFMSTITGIMPDAVTYAPSGVTAADAELLRKAAKSAVTEYGYVSYSTEDNLFVSALDKINSRSAGGKMDAMMIAGNLLNETKASDSFNAIVADYVGDGKTMFTIGEKDKSFANKIAFMYTSMLSKCYANDTEKSGQKRECNRHFVSNGIHLFGITYSSLTDGVPAYTDAALEWLDGELAAATDTSPDMPVFVVTSYPVTKDDGTPLSENLFNVLAKYRQVINVCGSSGKSLADNPVLYSGKFVSVNAGTLNPDSTADNEAALAQVDKDGNVRLTMFNITTGRRTTTVLPKTEKPQQMKGDFDGDGAITVADALAALRIGAKLVEETPEAIAIGDCDDDGHVTVADALAILRVAAKITDTL